MERGFGWRGDDEARVFSRAFWGGPTHCCCGGGCLGRADSGLSPSVYPRFPYKFGSPGGFHIKLLVFFQQFLKMPISFFTDTYDKESSCMYEQFASNNVMSMNV